NIMELETNNRTTLRIFCTPPPAFTTALPYMMNAPASRKQVKLNSTSNARAAPTLSKFSLSASSSSFANNPKFTPINTAQIKVFNTMNTHKVSDDNHFEESILLSEPNNAFSRLYQ